MKIQSLDNVAKVVGGITPKGFTRQPSDGHTPFFKVSDMNSLGNEKYIAKGNLQFSEKTIKNWRLKIIPKGSVTFPKIGGAIATNKKRIMGCNGAIDANTMAIIPSDKLNTNYLYYFMLALNLADYSTGSTMPQLSNKVIGQIEIPIPDSLKEQKRIAAKIDKLFAEIDKGIEKTKKSLEDGKNLLNSELVEVFSQKSNQGWELIDYGNDKFFYIETGSTPKTNVKNYWISGDIIWVTPKDLGQLKERIVKDSLRKITKKGLSSSSASLVPKGSIVISTRAPIGYVAIAGVELCFNQGCKAVVMNSPELSPEFLYYATLMSVDSMKALGKGSTFSEISKKKLESIKVFLPFKNGQPDLVEQKKIAKRLNKIRGQSKRLQEKYQEQLKNFELLKQSILNQAFQGKL